jgi:hypothetical protein
MIVMYMYYVVSMISGQKGGIGTRNGGENVGTSGQLLSSNGDFDRAYRRNHKRDYNKKLRFIDISNNSTEND